MLQFSGSSSKFFIHDIMRSPTGCEQLTTWYTVSYDSFTVLVPIFGYKMGVWTVTSLPCT